MDPSILPWRLIRRVVLYARRYYFSIAKPTGVPMIALEGVTISDLTNVLEGAHFEDGWELSYREQGEALNARRPSGTAAVKDVKHLQQQEHVRVWKTEGGLELHPHREVSPLSRRPDFHVRDIGLDKPEGVHRLKPVLEDAFGADAVTVSNMPSASAASGE